MHPTFGDGLEEAGLMDDSRTLSLTPAEAGFVVGRSPASLNKAVDDGVVEVTVRRDGKQRSRLFGPAELRFLLWDAGSRGDFTPSGRRKVYGALKAQPRGGRLSLDGFSVDLTGVERQLAERLRRLKALRRAVDGHGDGDPRLRGTGILVYVIAALAEGQSVDEVREDYPGLTAEQVATAVDYAQAYPKRGRPHPTRSFKRMLSDLAEAGVWDVESVPYDPTAG